MMIKSKNIYRFVFIVSLYIALFIIVLFSYTHPQSYAISSNWLLAGLLFLLSAFCEYIDSSIGMGYGTTLFPALLLLGLSRQDIVPSILLTQLIAGIACSLAHHKEGNVNLRTNKNMHQAIWMLGVPSLLGAVVASFLGIKLSIRGQSYLNLYIGIMISLIGVILVFKQLKQNKKQQKESALRLVLLGLFASFNKGVSGGGYGPLMTGGQIMAGVNGKEAIVITSVCESFTCLVALIAFFLFGGTVNPVYAAALCTGSLLTVIPSAKTVKIISGNRLKQIIGLATFILGLITIIKWIIT